MQHDPMQPTAGVAVLATHLPAADRRALSQAWYSALHLAERPPRARAAPPPARAHAAAPPAGLAHAAGCERAGAAVRADDGAARAAVRRTHAAGGRRDAAPAVERRAPASELARRIERGLARGARQAGAASFALRAAGGRVRILVRSDGARTRVVAVCAPPLRERVERALAQARFALAARGVRPEIG